MRATWTDIGLEEADMTAAPGIPVLPARYAELRRQLLLAVRRVCPAWLANDAEDLVQESLIRVMQRNERTPETLSVTPAYLKKVAYCAVVDEMRRRQRHAYGTAAGASTGVTPEDDVPDDSERNDDDAAMIGDAIAQCLSHQTAERRRALVLHLLGHTVPETARILGCKPKSAENLVYRGLGQLRECLAKKGLKP